MTVTACSALYGGAHSGRTPPVAYDARFITKTCALGRMAALDNDRSSAMWSRADFKRYRSTSHFDPKPSFPWAQCMRLAGRSAKIQHPETSGTDRWVRPISKLRVFR